MWRGINWGVFHRADLTQWLRGHGFVAVQPGNHVSPRSRNVVRGSVQERCKSCVVRTVFVRLTLHMGRTISVPEGATPASRPTVSSHARSNGSPSWEQLDSVDLSECLLRRVPMLVPSFPQEQVAAMLGFALRERYRAKLAMSMLKSVQWKLFCLVPMMILCKPKRWFSGSRRIGEADRRFRGWQMG